MLSRMVAFFMVPLYTAVLSESDYGVISITTSGFALVFLFVLLALDGAAHSWYWANPTPEEQRKTISSWFWTSQASGLVLGTLIFCFPAGTAALLFSKAGDLETWAVRTMALTLPLNFAAVVVQNWLRMQRRPLHFAWFSITVLVLNVGFCALFILGLQRGVGGNFEALVLTNAIVYVVSVFLLRKQIRPADFDRKRLVGMFRFSLPLIFCAIPGWALTFFDRRLLEQYHGTAEAGLYHVGSQLAQGVALATGAFATAWGPFSLSIQHEKDCRHTYAAAFIAYLMVGGVLATGLAIFAPEAIAVLTNKNYSGAADVTGILTIGVVAVGLYFVASTGMAISRKANSAAVAFTLAAGVLIGGCFIMVPTLGRTGAAIASSLAWCVLAAWSFFGSHRLYPIPYPFLRGALIALVFAGGAALLGHLPRGIAHPGEIEGWQISANLVISWQSLLMKAAGWMCLCAVAGLISWKSMKVILAARRSADAAVPAAPPVSV